jgi:GR25 family glycosyltransferase involved in LPS biosynthesis
MIRWALFFILILNIVYSDIEEHFRKITDKSDFHKMRNIDFIYMINLDERPEKYNLCMEQLTPYNIFPFRFSAINGWKLTIETINTIGVTYEPGMKRNLLGTCYLIENNYEPLHEIMKEGKVYFTYCMSRGAIGIVLSHLSVLQDAYDSGYKTIWVMEDDIHVIHNPHILSDLIDKLDSLLGKDGWDILFTDQDTKGRDGKYVPCFSYAPRPDFTPLDPKRFARRSRISLNFKKIGARYGAYSMIIRRSGIEKILNFLKNHRVFLPFDLEYLMPNDIRLFSLTSDIVSTFKDALSDNGVPTYKEIEDRNY